MVILGASKSNLVIELFGNEFFHSWSIIRPNYYNKTNFNFSNLGLIFQSENEKKN